MTLNSNNTHPAWTKLNVGSGSDYRPGYCNIDANPKLRHDLLLDVTTGHLTELFEPASITEILAFDIIEHLYRWEARALLYQFHQLLAPGGTLILSVPDAERIITDKQIKLDAKLDLLFGGQDVPQASASVEMNATRSDHPEFFCHKYGWTEDRIKLALQHAGFPVQDVTHDRTNLVVTTTKT